MPDSAALRETGEVAVVPAGSRVTVLRELWDEHAHEWIAWVRSPDKPDTYWQFHRERFLELVPGAGRLTLDIGCGEGRVARDLKRRGHRVLGVDWSEAMCKAAKTYHDESTRVVMGDAARLPLADGTVDCAVAFMSLQDIDDLDGAIKEIARVLKDGEKLALAIVHPMYSTGKFSSTENSGTGFVLSRPYFESQLCVSEDSRDGLKVTFFREHRPLQAYVHALINAGFNIEQLHEVTDEDKRSERHRVPMFLDIVAVRRPREKKESSVDRPRIVSRLPGRSVFSRDRSAENLNYSGNSRSSSWLGLLVTGAVLSGIVVTTVMALFASH
jgi:SAM-dependent methyltransferase